MLLPCRRCPATWNLRSLRVHATQKHCDEHRNRQASSERSPTRQVGARCTSKCRRHRHGCRSLDSHLRATIAIASPPSRARCMRAGESPNLQWWLQSPKMSPRSGEEQVCGNGVSGRRLLKRGRQTPYLYHCQMRLCGRRGRQLRLLHHYSLLYVRRPPCVSAQGQRTQNRPSPKTSRAGETNELILY